MSIPAHFIMFFRLLFLFLESFLKTLEATIQDFLGGCNSLTLLILEFYGDPEHEVIDSWIERPISGDGTMVVFIYEQTTNRMLAVAINHMNSKRNNLKKVMKNVIGYSFLPN